MEPRRRYDRQGYGRRPASLQQVKRIRRTALDEDTRYSIDQAIEDIRHFQRTGDYTEIQSIIDALESLEGLAGQDFSGYISELDDIYGRLEDEMTNAFQKADRLESTLNSLL
jgi:ABC-type transporter Mla subunit MlaD